MFLFLHCFYSLGRGENVRHLLRDSSAAVPAPRHRYPAICSIHTLNLINIFDCNRFVSLTYFFFFSGNVEK